MSEVIVLLPAPVSTDEGDRLARLHVQVDVLEHGHPGYVFEGLWLKSTLPSNHAELDGVRRVVISGTVSSTSMMRSPPAIAR